MGACILARWRATLGMFVYFWMGLGAALGIVLVLVLISGGEILAGPVLLFFAVVAAILLAFLIWDLITCLVSPSAPVPPPPPPFGSGFLTSQVDCATATQQLADARARLAQLRAELDAQVARVVTAQQRANAARMALSGAAATVAASIFAPWMLPVALTALAAATVATWHTARAVEAELATLDSLAQRFALAQRDLSAAELVATQSCTMPPTPTTPPVGGIGVTPGTLQRIARGPGRCAGTAV